ncbi:MAG: hypothetical protein JXC32_07275, partial [Anaerolineae bacterium]|nr:hypothetical protein [Anaerolineae bacterium]
PRTQIRGQKLYRDLTHNFSFWRPLNWHQGQLDKPPGVVVYPEEDPRTGFYVSVTELADEGNPVTHGEITRDDLPILREGLIEGLKALTDCTVLSEQEIAKEHAIGFEFLLTFALDGAPYKQRLRVLYSGQRQYTIYGQGTPGEEYDVFANTFDYMYLTLRFGDLLLDMGVPLMPGMEPHYIPPDN